MNPTTPTLRWKNIPFTFNTLSNFKPTFFKKIKHRAGRSNEGRILVRHRCKKYNNSYISTDLRRVWSNQQAVVLDLKFKATNNTYLALVKYSNGSLSFISLPHGLFIGNYVNTQSYLYRLYNKILLGRCLPLKFLKKFTIIFNVCTNFKARSAYAMSSGTYCRLLYTYKDFNLVKLILPSGAKYVVSGNNLAVLGRNSNIKKKYQTLGGAKAMAYSGKRPTTRGVAMNPVDHPHGGRTKTNSPEVSIWGWVTKHSH